jgi:multiple sugar transport system permease protein
MNKTLQPDLNVPSNPVIKDRPGKVWRRIWRGQNIGYLFIAPAVLLLLGFTAYPLLLGVVMSLTKVSRTGVIGQWNGFTNWPALLQDQSFLASFGRTLKFSVTGTIGALVVGLVLAQLLNMAWLTPGVQNFLRGLTVLPWLFSSAVAAIMWGLLLHRDGLINAWLMQVGLIHNPLQFTGAPQTALYSLSAIFTWRIIPFIMVMILAALKSIPNELYEAASVDGASKWQSFWGITIPLIMPLLLTLAILTLVWGVGQFDFIRIITGGGPIESTTVVSYYIYIVGFLTQNWSYGATISVAVFLVNLIFALVYLYLSARAKPWSE